MSPRVITMNAHIQLNVCALVCFIAYVSSFEPSRVAAVHAHLRVLAEYGPHVLDLDVLPTAFRAFHSTPKLSSIIFLASILESFL